MKGRPRYDGISPCEQPVLDLMCLGKSNPDIAQVLNKSRSTVAGQVRRIIKKMDAENRTQAVAKHLKPELFKK